MPVRDGSEEYLNSEKYEIRQRDLDGPLLPMIRRLNEIRRENPALQHLQQRLLARRHNDQILAYLKQEPGNAMIVAANLDPHNAQEGLVTIPATGHGAGVRGRGPHDRRALRLADRRQLRAPGPAR